MEINTTFVTLAQVWPDAEAILVGVVAAMPISATDAIVYLFTHSPVIHEPSAAVGTASG